MQSSITDQHRCKNPQQEKPTKSNSTFKDYSLWLRLIHPGDTKVGWYIEIKRSNTLLIRKKAIGHIYGQLKNIEKTFDKCRIFCDKTEQIKF